MRLFTLILFSFALASIGHAAAESETGFLLKTQITTLYDGKMQQKEREFILSEDNHLWVPLIELEADRLTLLGRRIDSVGETIHMEYRLLDTRVTPPRTVSQSSIIARLGEPAQIGTKDEHGQVDISLRATRTTYSTEE